MYRKNKREYVQLIFITLFVLIGAETAVSGPTFFSALESYSSESPLAELIRPGDTLEEPDEKRMEHHIDNLVESMDDTELLGQIFLLGYFGQSPSEEILRWIEEKKIGGVKIFGWNSESIVDLAKSISTMQKSALETRLSIPLFVATDQEGGWVRHVKNDTSITPGNMAIGATGLPYDAYNSAFHIGDELKSIGINMNFAPTVDVYTNKDAHVIGPRSFSDDPIKTARLAEAYFKGMEKAGIVCTAKHFPGHGNATEDSHGTLPDINTSFSVLWERELLPYRFLINRDIPAIMSGHLSFPSVIPKDRPASLSPFFLEETLREKMGFDGIVITDDMRMHSVSHTKDSTPSACLRAFKAGNDMVMVSRDAELYERIYDLFVRELDKNDAFRSRLERSVKRILKTKFEYLLGPKAVPLIPRPERVKDDVPSPEANEFFFDQACRSVSIIRDKHLPIDKDNERILIAGQLKSFLRTGNEYFPEADTYHFPYSPFYDSSSSTIRELRRKTGRYDTVIFCLANPNSAQVLDGLKDVESDVVVLSTLTPVYLNERDWVQTAVAVYGTGKDSSAAGFATLRGMIEPDGRVPISSLGWEAKTKKHSDTEVSGDTDTEKVPSTLDKDMPVEKTDTSSENSETSVEESIGESE